MSRRRGSPLASRRLRIEQLEARKLFAVNVTLSSGQLALTGDTAAELIVLQETPGDPTKVRAGIYDITGSTVLWEQDFTMSSVTSGVIDGNAGDDNIRVFPLSFPISVDPDAGNDLLVAFGTGGNDGITAGDNVDSSDPNDAVVVTPSGGSAYGAISYVVDTTETLVINAGSGNDIGNTYSTNPDGSAAGTRVLFSGEDGTDEVTMNGTAGADTMYLTAAPSGGWQEMTFAETGRQSVGYDPSTVEKAIVAGQASDDILYTSLVTDAPRKFTGGDGSDIVFLLGTTGADNAILGDTDYSGADTVDSINVTTGSTTYQPLEYDLATTEFADFFGDDGNDSGIMYPGNLNAATQTHTMFDGGDDTDSLVINGTSSGDIFRSPHSEFDNYWHHLHHGTFSDIDTRPYMRFSTLTENVRIDALGDTDWLIANQFAFSSSSVTFNGGDGVDDFLWADGTASTDAITIGDTADDQYDDVVINSGKITYDTTTTEFVNAAGFAAKDIATIYLSSGISELMFDGGDAPNDDLHIYGTIASDNIYGGISLPGDDYWARLRFLSAPGNTGGSDTRPRVTYSINQTETVFIHGGDGNDSFEAIPGIVTGFSFDGDGGTGDQLQIIGRSDDERFDIVGPAGSSLPKIHVANLSAITPFLYNYIEYDPYTLESIAIDGDSGDDEFRYREFGLGSAIADHFAIEVNGEDGVDNVLIYGADNGADNVAALGVIGDLSDTSKYVSTDGAWQAVRIVDGTGVQLEDFPAIHLYRDTTESVEFEGRGGDDTFAIGPSDKTAYWFLGGMGNDTLTLANDLYSGTTGMVQEWQVDNHTTYDEIVVTRDIPVTGNLVLKPVRLLDSNLNDGDSNSNGIDAYLTGGNFVDDYFINSWFSKLHLDGGAQTDTKTVNGSGGTTANVTSSNIP